MATRGCRRVTPCGPAVRKSEIKPGSWLEKEIEYLINEKGYRWLNQWSLAKP
jgi:hypothetical protein